MLDEMENLKKGDIDNIPTNMLFPLMTWNSGEASNIRACNEVNKLFYFVKPRILMGLLSLTINKNTRFIRYPKTKAEKDKKLLILKPHLKKLYKWSEREWKLNLVHTKPLTGDKEFLRELSIIVGMEKKECKALGIEFKKFKINKIPKRVTRSLFSFGV